MSDGFHDDELKDDEEPTEDALLGSEDTEDEEAPEGTGGDEEDLPFAGDEDDESQSNLDKFGFTENRDDSF